MKSKVYNNLVVKVIENLIYDLEEIILDKKTIKALKTMDTSDLAFNLANRFRDNEPSAMYHCKGIVAAYILYQAEKDKSIKMNNWNDFLEATIIPQNMKSIFARYAESVWDTVQELKGKYEPDYLLSFILFNNDLEDNKSGDCSTPESISKLACAILDIGNSDSVLDLCSGKGNFIIEATESAPNATYTGVELNYTLNDIAQIRSSLLSDNINFEMSDALEFRLAQKVDKGFSNFPFMVRTPAMVEYKKQLQEVFGFPQDVIQKASSDWVFSSTVVEQIKDTGKAVVIVTNGSTWNSSDKNIRKFFVENGLIEAVITLPAKLFSAFSIQTTMIVFSKNNKNVRLVDAQDMFIKTRKVNVISDDDISKIVELLGKDGEKSVSMSFEEIAQNDYILNATRYLKMPLEVKNGVELGKLIKNITRGAQLKADDLDSMKSDVETPYQYLLLSNINDGIISLDEGQYLSNIPDNFKKYCIKNNSVVLSKIGVPAFKSAVAQIEEDTFLLANGNLFVIEFDEEQVNPYYVQAFFASEYGVSMFKSIYAGAALPTLSVDKLKQIIIPLPLLSEQKIIADKYAASMDEIVILKRKLEKTVAKMKHIYDEENEHC